MVRAESNRRLQRPVPATRQWGVAMTRRAVLSLGLLAVAVFVGFCVGWGVLLTLDAVLPPFRPEDDDTLRELIPVALTYLTWAATTLVVLVAGWRRIRRRA